MAAKDHLNSVLFGFNVRIQPPMQKGHRYTNPEIRVTDHTGDIVASMDWDAEDGMLGEVEVDYQHRNMGIATEMWKLAKQTHKDSPWHYPDIKPSSWRTEEGDVWAKSLHRKGLSEEPPYNEYEE